MKDLIDELMCYYSSEKYNNLLIRFIYSSIRDYNLQCLKSFLKYKFLHKNYELIMIDKYKGLTAKSKKERYITDIIIIIYNSDFHQKLTTEEVNYISSINNEIRNTIINNFILYNFILEDNLYVYL